MYKMLQNISKKVRSITFLFIPFLFNSFEASSQCAMCRAQLESMEDNSMAEGINDGIIILMAAPYILVGILGFIIYRKFFKKKI